MSDPARTSDAVARPRPLGLRTTDARPHRTRCYRCFKAEVTCICRSLERVANKTGVIILQPALRGVDLLGARDLATLPEDEHPRHLLILDGTWTHAKKIYAAQGWLHALPHLRLMPAEPSRYRLRREPQPDYVATLEAVVAALRILEPRTRGLDGLLASFAAMIDRQVAYTVAASARGV